MATTINQYPRNIQVRAINKLIDKYGHVGTLTTTPGLPESCMVMFGKYTVKYSSGSLIVNNNYKLHIKPIGKIKFDTLPKITTSKIVVNGVSLTALSIRKIAPDGANPVVWEIETAGSVIPYDVPTIYPPTIIAPTNNTSDWPTVAESGGLWSTTLTGSRYRTLNGEAASNGAEWQISTNNEFTAIVASVTNWTSSDTWTTPVVLARNTNYWARVRYTSLTATTTPWSPLVLFNLDTIIPGSVATINQPTIALPAADGVIATSLRNQGSGANAGKYRVHFKLSTYAPITAGAMTSSYWQFSTVSDFSTILCECSSFGGPDDYTGSYYPDGTDLIMPDSPAPFPYPMTSAVTYYCRARYVSGADTSAWSPTRAFTVPA